MKTDLSPYIAEIARRILGAENKERSSRTELRFGTHGSVSVVIAGTDRGKWYDHENDVGGGPSELIREKGRIPDDQMREWLLSELGVDIAENEVGGGKRIIATYDYPDECGELLFQVVRFEPKDFRQRRPDGRGNWIWSTKGVRHVPYRLPELLAAPPEAPVFIVEGEKDANNVAARGLVATCNAGGAAKSSKTNKRGQSSKWHPGLNQFFRGRDVVVLPDNDEAGRNHAQTIVENLLPVARSVRLVELPGLPPKGDVSDWLDSGGTVQQLRVIVETTAPIQHAERPEHLPDHPTGDLAEIARLASLPLIEYGRQRIAAAKRLGCAVVILDRAVQLERGTNGNSIGQGRAIELVEHEPWPEPVDGAALLGAISAEIRRYVVIGGSEADAVALWIVAAHAFDNFYIFPRLFIRAEEKQCGKTTLLNVIGCLVTRMLSTENITPAATYRTIEKFRPTLLLDEADTFLKDNEEMRGILDSGHKRDGTVIRVVGDDNEPRCFSTWSPVALAGIGKLPGTIEDRSISPSLKRRRVDEKIDSFRADRPNGLGQLAQKATRWVSDHAVPLGEADPAMPPGIINRPADNWRPLLAVADLAGGEWPLRARIAATRLIDEDQSRGVQLLSDIRAAFESLSSDRLSSKELVDHLVSLDDRPWAEFNKDRRPLSQPQLARLLKRYQISPGTIRLDDSRTPKGYRREQFEDAFARYLPSQTATPPQPAENLGFRADSKAPQETGCGGSESVETPSVSAACGVVAVSEPLFWAKDAVVEAELEERNATELEERAAILEHDGGLSREEAERLAPLSRT